MAFQREVFYADEDERVFFSPMLPEEVRKNAELIIGCVLDQGERIVPGGVLAASGFEEGFVTIDFLFVPESERRQGIGRELLGQLTVLHQNPEMGIDSFRCEYVRNEHTESLDAFLTAMGFAEDEGAAVYCFRLDQIKQRLREGSVAERDRIHSLGELPAQSFYQLANEILRRSEAGKAGATYLPLSDRSVYDPDYSLLYLDDAYVCQGCVLVSRDERGLSLDHLCYLKADGAEKIRSLLLTVLQKVAAAEAPETEVRVSAVVKSAAGLVERFCAQPPMQEGIAVSRVLDA